MTGSSTLASATESSQDWSASYRFDNRRGVTSVCTLPGQTALADHSASLKGVNFRSGPHRVDAGPYHTESGQAPASRICEAKNKRHELGAHANARPFGPLRHSSPSRQPPGGRVNRVNNWPVAEPEVFDHVKSWLLEVPTSAHAYSSPSKAPLSNSARSGSYSSSRPESRSGTSHASPVVLVAEPGEHFCRRSRDYPAPYQSSATTTEAIEKIASQPPSRRPIHRVGQGTGHNTRSPIPGSSSSEDLSSDDGWLPMAPLDLQPYMEVSDPANEARLQGRHESPHSVRRGSGTDPSPHPASTPQSSVTSSRPSLRGAKASDVPLDGPTAGPSKPTTPVQSSERAISKCEELHSKAQAPLLPPTPELLEIVYSEKNTYVSDASSSDSPLSLSAVPMQIRQPGRAQESVTSSGYRSAPNSRNSPHYNANEGETVSVPVEKQTSGEACTEMATATVEPEASVGHDNSATGKDDVHAPLETALSLPRPSILRNASYAILPDNSPVRKSVAFDEEIAVDIPEPPVAADIHLPTHHLQCSASQRKASTANPITDILTDTSSSSGSDEDYDDFKSDKGNEPAECDSSSRAETHSLRQSQHSREASGSPDVRSEAERPATESQVSHKGSISSQRHAYTGGSPAVRPGGISRQSSPTSHHSRNRTTAESSAKLSNADSPAGVANGIRSQERSIPPDPSEHDHGAATHSNLPPEASSQPIIRERILYDYVRKQNVAGWCYRSGVVMPLLPDIEVFSLGCSKVTRALRRCRDSTVYKRLRKLIWRFHLDLEDLNKVRQRQWVPLVENCVALVNRMMEDLIKGYTFRDRWDRGRYGHILGDAQGRDQHTIFFMFVACTPLMRVGVLYVQEARSVLRKIAEQANEHLQATLTGDPVASAMVQRHEHLARSLDFLEVYFATLADSTARIRDVMLVAMTQMVQMEVPKLISKLTDPDDLTPEQIHTDTGRKSDLTAWLDVFLRQCLRQWGNIVSKAAYENSLKCFRNYDRVWEEEGPNFGLLRSIFCLGIFLPREQRTKLVGWHFVDRELAPEMHKTQIDADDPLVQVETSKKQAKNSRKAALLSTMRAKSRAFLLKVLEKFFASWEDEDDQDSLQDVQRAGHINNMPQRALRLYRPEDADLATEAEQLLDERPSSPIAECMDTRKTRLLAEAMDLIGHIGSNRYRSALLDLTEGRAALWAQSSNLPPPRDLERIFPLPPEPSEKVSVYHVEWEYLKAYVDFLNTDVATPRELWQIYLIALEMFGLDDLHRAAQNVYTSLYGRRGQAST